MGSLKINLPFLYRFFLFVWILFIPMKNSVYQISIVLLIALFLFDIAQKKNYASFIDVLNVYKDIMIGFCLILVSMSISNYLGVQAPKAWYLEGMFILRYGFIGIILIYGYYKNYINQKIILLMILFSLTLHGINGLYQHIFDIDFISGHRITDGTWLSGAVFYYNPFGMLMGLGAAITLSLLIYCRKEVLSRFQHLFLFIVLSLFLYTLLFSLSRAAWVAFGVFTVSIMAFDYKKLNKTLLFMLVLLFCSLAVVMIYNETSILLRVKQLLEGDSSNRYEIWKATFEAFLQHPYFGYGLNSFKEVVLNQSQYNGVHNSLLEILLFLGLFGLSAFSVMLFLVLREIYRQKKLQYFSFLLFFLSISQFDHSLFSSKIFLSILTLFFFFLFSQRISLYNNSQ